MTNQLILQKSVSLMADIERAQKAGFPAEFRFAGDELIDRVSNKAFDPSECMLIAYCRHEGLNDPGDSTILFLITCQDGTKGYISSAYGVHADVDLIEFVSGMKTPATKFSRPVISMACGMPAQK